VGGTGHRVLRRRCAAALPLSHALGSTARSSSLLAGTSRAGQRFARPSRVCSNGWVTVCLAWRPCSAACSTCWASGSQRATLGVSGAAPCPWIWPRVARLTGVHRPRLDDQLFRPLSYSSDDPTDHAECVGRPAPAGHPRGDDDGHAWGRRDWRAAHPHPRGDGRYLDSPEDTRAVSTRLVPHRRPRAGHRRRLRGDRRAAALHWRAASVFPAEVKRWSSRTRPSPGRCRDARRRWAERSPPSSRLAGSCRRRRRADRAVPRAAGRLRVPAARRHRAGLPKSDRKILRARLRWSDQRPRPARPRAPEQTGGDGAVVNPRVAPELPDRHTNGNSRTPVPEINR
jgi:hypothetical protein